MLPVWGDYIWRGLYMEGLFSEFYGIVTCTCTITGQAFHNFVDMVHLTQQHKIKQ